MCLFRFIYFSKIFYFKWWSLAGSNRWPPACKAGARPAELKPHSNGREDRIWTCDPLVPNQVHYQAVLLPDTMARQTGVEPVTSWSVVKHSIQLSYWRIALKDGASGRSRTGTEFEVRGILSPVRLPISPPRQFGGSCRTWTDDRRVAVFCLTNLAKEPSFMFRGLPCGPSPSLLNQYIIIFIILQHFFELFLWPFVYIEDVFKKRRELESFSSFSRFNKLCFQCVFVIFANCIL